MDVYHRITINREEVDRQLNTIWRAAAQLRVTALRVEIQNAVIELNEMVGSGELGVDADTPPGSGGEEEA